ncbi:MAG: DUF533 domain-containing protein [Planctomycetota bacterium]
MDAMDVLGALLGKKAGRPSPGGQILKDILGGSSQSSQTTNTRRTHPRTNSSPSRSSRRPASIGDAARSLEELLGVSNSRYEKRHPQQTRRQERQTSRSYAPPTREEEDALNAQSVVLIRAMISASKADGQIDDEEQQSITRQLGHLSDAEIRFLRDEFRKSHDAKEIAWNTPLGMEDQVYTMSLIAIDLDEQKEAEYLADLAHGLRMPTKRCNQIHRKYNAPEIFRE